MCFGSDKTARPTILPQPAMIKKILLFFAFVCLSAHAFAAPAHVVIRVPAGTAQPPELAPLLAKWRQSGQVSGVLLLTQGRAEKPAEGSGFEAFVALEFPNEAAVAAWERDAAPAVPKGLIVRRADVLVHGELTPRESNRSIFLVNTYTPTVPKAAYDEFAQGYLRPLYEAQRATKHLVRYTMFLERGTVGAVQSFGLLEFRDPVAFARIGDIKDSLREKLTATVPTYAKFHPAKDNLRKGGPGTFATYTELPPPDLSARPTK